MKFPVYEFVGGPKDGDSVVLHEGNRCMIAYPPDMGPAMRGEKMDATVPRLRTASYTLRWVKDVQCLVWDGE